jgi:histidine kinase
LSVRNFTKNKEIPRKVFFFEVRSEDLDALHLPDFYAFMITLPGYQVFEKRYESSRSLIYRAERNADQVPVLLKVLRQEYPSPKAIARFQMEYHLLQSLNLEGVIQVYDWKLYQQSPVIVLEDFGGESLQNWLHDYPEGGTASHRTFDLEEFLTLAIQITSILGQLHHQNIIHKDINPSNIVLNSNTGQVKIIDFGIATTLSQENSITYHPSILEGTLAYMSPEQTGRMNRAIDYRTDFYSLGVTFYRLLCDRLPFETTDVMELVHCHIAKHPTPPHEVNSAIPRPVSDLVMKLLAKTAEDRYQSATGIWSDLQECLNQLQQTGHIEAFTIGRWDLSSTFQIPQKLYGRTQAIERLLEAIGGVGERDEREGRMPASASAIANRAELIVIAGQSGIGKTTLVQELYQFIPHPRGYFVTGKYDQLQRNIPYAALLQAFQALIRQLLTEDETRIDRWRESLLAALGQQAALMIDMLPELELLIGQQSIKDEASIDESRNRFDLILENFIRAFTESIHQIHERCAYPLIIFLDDLQWIDSASLSLIERLLSSDSHDLLIIGAYRENEVGDSHPLTRSLHEIRQAGGLVHQIALSPLSLLDVNEWLQDTLHCESARSSPLAELMMQKTAGNPFFINEFLRVLHQEKLLNFNVQQGFWQWDLKQIQAANLTDSVVELVTERIQKIPSQSRQLLCLAACVGSSFNLQTLATVSERSPLEVAGDLRNAIQQNLIAPLGEEYQYLEAYRGDDVDITYKFLHDRIQQTVYSSITETLQKEYHLLIGQQILKSTPEQLLEDKIFTIVHHLNIGSELIVDQEQKHQLARLNLIAGKKAKATIAYDSALQYLNQGRTLLTTNSWQNAYELTLALCESTAKAAYLAGDFEQMVQRVQEVLDHAKTPLETTQVHLVMIQAHIAQERFVEAIESALQALESLGIHLSIQPDSPAIAQEWRATKHVLADQSLETLLHLPRMTDPSQLAAMQIISSVCTPTYFLAPDLWKMMVFQKIQLSVRYGNAPGSAFGYADYGMILCGVEGDIRAGCQFSQLASTLQPLLQAKEFVPKTTLLVNMYLKHWQAHLKETLSPLLEAYQSGLETGDLEYATFAIAFRFYHAYLVGQELTQLEQEMASYEETIAQFNQSLPLNLIRVYRQAVLSLISQHNNPDYPHNSGNPETSLPQLTNATDPYILFHQFLNRLILCYLFEDFAQAAEHAATTAHLLSGGAVGLLVVTVFDFYDSLAKIAVYPNVSPAEQQQILQTVDAHQQKMKQWAEHAPMNYLHKFYLVEAERHRILGQDAAAMDAYDQAIDLAQAQEYGQEEALANELAGRFYLAKGKTKFAKTYLLEARYGYVRWGATAKVQDLDQRYPQFFDLLSEKNRLVTPYPPASTASSSTDTAALDLAALMKAAQALSGEIVLEKLLAKLMLILMENAGAERGCLLLETQGQLQIEAEGNAESGCTSVLMGLPMNSNEAKSQVSTAIVNYVARTQESVVLNQATQDYRFHQDAYILAHQPKSLLCTPLIYQGKLSGILYLENNLTTNAFTPDRLEVLQLLSTQAAISLDNARLYSQLELRVQERTAELTQTNDRLQAEIIERQRSEQTLRLIVEGTASVTGEDFFRSLVRSLAQALDVRYAFISECVDLQVTRIRTFVFWQGSEFGENFEYRLQGTPCEKVIGGQGWQCFPEQIQTLFPEDVDLVKMQAQSYAGIALLDSTGSLLGHLAILDDKPMENEFRNRAVLEIFAARAAAEMERQQAEEALRISEAKFSTAFRSSPDAITISTLNDGRYIEVNDSCLRMFGYAREEMIGQNSLDLEIWANSDDRNAIKQLLQQQEKVTNLEVKLRKKSGEIFPGLFSAEVISLENEPCLLSVATDITMLKQAEKALERLAEIGGLASMIVHEVRNPLTTITMGLTAFKRLQLSDRFQEYLSLALDEADRLQRLLNQILLYAKPQTLQRSQLELTSFVAETLSTLQTMPVASGKNLQLVATEPVTVLADRDKLKQVFINLITNACEAITEGENVTVYIQSYDRHQVCIQVHNGGTPIPREILVKLSQPFFTTKASGTGLGLAIVKRIAEAHGGELSIESSEACGTLVKVQFSTGL